MLQLESIVCTNIGHCGGFARCNKGFAGLINEKTRELCQIAA